MPNRAETSLITKQVVCCSLNAQTSTEESLINSAVCYRHCMDPKKFFFIVVSAGYISLLLGSGGLDYCAGSGAL